MSTRALEDICEKLCRELDEIAKKPELGAGDLDIVHKLTDTMKNIYKIEMYEEDGGYSRAGEWEADICAAVTDAAAATPIVGSTMCVATTAALTLARLSAAA